MKAFFLISLQTPKISLAALSGLAGI